MRRIQISKILIISLLLSGCIELVLTKDSHGASQEQHAESTMRIPQSSGQSNAGLSFSELLSKYLDLNKYFYELLLVLLIMIYLLNYFTGKNANAKIAAYWVQENKEVFEQDFTHIGVTSLAGGALLDQESANSFKFYATGRVNCMYAMATIELKRRQDLLTMMIFNFIWPEKDRISIEIPLDIKYSIPVVFAIVRAKESKTVYSNNSDLKAFCKKVMRDELEGKYVAFGENVEAAEYILTPPIVALLKKYEKIIQMILLTDQSRSAKMTLKADLLLPHNFSVESKEFKPILKMLLYLVDSITNIKLSAPARAKAEKERAVLDQMRAKEDAEKRNEETQKKKLEEKKKEDERRKNLPKEKQSKLEEKERQKEMKKKMSRKLVKIG